MLMPLNFPKTPLKLSKKGEEIFVWDIFRKKKLLLTPEEWVRQHVLHFLIQHKETPEPLIAAEYAIEVNKMTRRCDGVVFNRDGKAVAIVECKAPQIKLTEAVLHQIAQYNYKLRVNWLILTNGLHTIVAFVDQSTGVVQYHEEIPNYSELIK
ncbi:restriction endonuclease subunit R [Brumimicrobium salinarum]|uniref:Restriction endonuclease subunit R n=1 Tax=Brumimicrobium salinarum TaxID=2058658 RepID=A0A2I0R2H8_9FLAO|nr:type I restriction enzyme HsdR N-terminal domain-containing protein [Brumimicrobium salinarum]PKR80788.1 restriction endonuclease subunit R [Brumimicrobium salinarum]